MNQTGADRERQDAENVEKGPQLKVTGDGSHTLYVPHLDEHYHSHFGAVTESRHIFINAGLASVTADIVAVLEVGFGTGLNALLSCLYATETMTRVDYVTIEKYPVSQSMAAELNYSSLVGDTGGGLFRAIHDAPWGQKIAVTPYFNLTKLLIDLTVQEPSGTYDVIFYDAFGPDKQPEMWTHEVLKRVDGTAHSGTVFVTYSAKGELKRILRQLGYDVTHLPGPPGKRVMTRATRR